MDSVWAQPSDVGTGGRRNLDVVIRSYHRDLRWLKLATTSIRRLVTGYRHLVVVLPAPSVDRLSIETWLPDSGIRLVVCSEHEEDDYLGQQLCKLHADRHSDAAVIVHVDSDQLFLKPCNLSRELLLDGRPRMALGVRQTRPTTDGWRRCPELFFGQRFDVDLTCPPPLVVDRRLYPALRAYCIDRHGVTVEEYARTAGADRFCELALLRAYALLFKPNLHAWVVVQETPMLTSCRTFWSRYQSPASAAALLDRALGTEFLA